MFIPKRYTVRHAILKHLLDKQEADPDKNIKNTTSKHTEIAEKQNVNAKDIITFHEVLIDRKHITCDELSSKQVYHEITLTLDGRTAALEETYLNEGIESRNKSVDFVFKITVPLLALFISAFSTCQSIKNYNYMKDSKQKIDTLQSEIDKLKYETKRLTPLLKEPSQSCISSKDSLISSDTNQAILTKPDQK